MTNYLLPETDRLAAEVNPLLTDIAAKTPEIGKAIEVGALTVIGLLGESMADLRDKAIEQAHEQGLPAAVAVEPYNVIRDTLADILQPRLDALRDAVFTAQGVPSAEESVEALVNGLLVAMFGPDEAASILAEVAAEADEDDEAEFWDSYDDVWGYDDEDEEEEEEKTPEQELEEFFATLFGTRV